MSSLFSSLHTASAALDAFSRALGTDQANVANAATPGYAAQRASINAIDLSGGGGATGSDTVSVSSATNQFTDAAVQAASSQASESQTQVKQLTAVNQLFDITGATGILAALQQFSTAFSSLSVHPNDATLGAAALSSAANVAGSFRSVANALNSQRTQVDAGIQSTVSRINALSTQVRQLNVQANREAEIQPGTDSALRSTLDQLSSLVDITVTRNPNGSVAVLAGGQLPLVIGDQAYALSANPAAAAGAQVTSSAGGNSPASFSGELGALLQVRNGAIGQLLGSGGNPGSLNTLAAGFASRVNTLLASGVDASGAAGIPAFSYDATKPANAAASLTLNPSLTAARLGLASTGTAVQSNGIANQLAALSGSNAAADQIGGTSAEGFFGLIAASAGQQLSDASNASTAGQTSLTDAQTSRQQAIGVSLDQEAVAITAFQRAYQANAQVVTILNQLTQVAVNLIPAA